MGKVFAILGDIHANLEALNAVLDDCRKEGVTDFLCTGDIVGYNASPKECLNIIRELNCPVVKGNHDHYVSSDHDLSDFHPNAAFAVQWTREQLSADDIDYLAKLPFVSVNAGMTLVHATMDNPERFGYVFDHLQAEANFTCQKTPICFHGHTHCPLLYEKQLNGIYRIDAQDFHIPVGRKYFINVGSVGQPRDSNPLAAYAIYDLDARQLKFRRVEYDIASARERIMKAGLPQKLADRLEVGQ